MLNQNDSQIPGLDPGRVRIHQKYIGIAYICNNQGESECRASRRVRVRDREGKQTNYLGF
jgi:hypothetical protein